MTINKRSKVSRRRGATTHGYGSMKKNRGAGHRGGRGKAGSGKRADVKKPSLGWKPRYFGKYGFTSKSRTKINAVNITYLDIHADKLVDQKLMSKDGDVYTVELSKLGYNKLLGNGTVKSKFKINTTYASKKAIEKIQAAGGEVIAAAQQE